MRISDSILYFLFDQLPFSIGARLGLSEHPDDNRHVFEFSLSDQDRVEIEAVLERSNGRKIIMSVGDCGAEYR